MKPVIVKKQKNSQKGEVATVIAVISLAIIIFGTIIGSQKSIQKTAFRLLSFSAGEKVQLTNPLSTQDRGDYYLLSSSVCFSGLTIPSNPGRYWVHTEKKPDGVYAASSVQYIAPQASRPYCNSGGTPWEFTLKIFKNDLSYLCGKGLLFTASSAFAVNEAVGGLGDSLKQICPQTTPTPTTSSACFFKPVNFVKERVRASDGSVEDRLITTFEDSSKWGSQNDKSRAKWGEDPGHWNRFGAFGTPCKFEPCKNSADSRGCNLTGRKYCCVDYPDNQPPFGYEIGKDKAFVKLYYDSSKYVVIDRVCTGTGCPVREDLNADVNPAIISNLPVACNNDYEYGWILEKCGTGTVIACPTTTPTTPPDQACSVNGPGWIDADRSRLRSSNWFGQHKYGDCPS